MIQRIFCGITIGVICAMIIITLIFLSAAVVNVSIENSNYVWMLLIGGGFIGAVWSILPEKNK